MSYQVLARKWRPRSFGTLVGQEHVVRALTHGLQEGRLHHAYLFTGTRGVGKTTIARILAKSLNCESGVSATPCGTCSACAEIDAGRFVDLLEVDAATNTRVDEMRQLLENAVYAPTRGRYKVYVIDEVHMLSTAAFNAMLKTLEEPPEHVKFILATTDPQKIPVTVLSRCLQFNLKQMSQTSIVDHLATVLDSESVAFELPGVKLIARAANGSMRDALSLLDQAIAYGNGRVETETVSTMLGTLGNDHLYHIVEALLENDPPRLKAVADDLAVRSLSYDAALQSLAELLVLIQSVQMGCAEEASDAFDPRVTAIASRMGVEYVQLAYTVVLQGRAQLALAPDPAAGFLMTLLRLHAFRPEIGEADEKKNTEVTNRGELKARTPASPVAGSFASLPASEKASGHDAKSTVSGVVPEVSIRVSASGNVREISRHEALRPAAVSEIMAQEGATAWSELLASLKLAGLVRELASHCELVDQTRTQLTLRLGNMHRHLLGMGNQERLIAILTDALGVEAVSIVVGETAGETPAQLESRVRADIQGRAVAAIHGDPFVRELIEALDATVIDTTVRSCTE